MPRIRLLNPPTAGEVAGKIDEALRLALTLRTSVPHGSEADHVVFGRIAAYKELLHWIRTGSEGRKKR